MPFDDPLSSPLGAAGTAVIVVDVVKAEPQITTKTVRYTPIEQIKLSGFD